MKIKNVLKSLAIGALVVPCALAFTGCGKETVKIDTRMPASATSATTCAEASEYFNNTASTESISNGYRMSMEMDMVIDLGGEFTMKTATDAYGIVVIDENDKVGMSMEMTTKADDYKVKTNFYVKDNIMYYDYNGKKIKFDIATEFGESFDVTTDMTNAPSMEDIGELFDESLGLNYEVYQNEGTTKFKIYGENSETEDSVTYNYTYEVYFVFENDVLTGIQYGMKAEYTGGSMEMVMSMEAYEGTVDYPSLEGYEEGTMPDII